MKRNVKQEIKEKSLQLFADKGYYGTSIRDIAKAVDCSLPTVYYYFKNKEELYEELAYNDFLLLNDSLKNKVPVNHSIENMYIQSLLNRLHLTGNDRLVYTLAQKTILGLNGDFDVRKKLLEWEDTRFKFSHYLFNKYFDINNPIYGNILSRITSNIMVKGLLYNENLDDSIVKEELKTLFKMIMEVNK